MGLFKLFRKPSTPSSKKPKTAKNSPVTAKRPAANKPRVPISPTPAPAKKAVAFQIPSCVGVDATKLNAALRRKDPQVSQPDMDVFCAVRQVRVYCHSHILDKMSDLTKFIICSIAEGRTVDDILALTQLGDHAVEDETAYLKKGRLLEEKEQLVLTPLGWDHFRLIQIFAGLSKGIEAQLNVYTDRIEARPERVYGQEELAPDAFILDGKPSKVLLQNYNYSNSLEFIQPFIQEDTPFQSEILESLYTTIRLEKNERTSLYQRLRVPSLYEGTYPGCVEGAICFAVPVHEIHYRLRICALDPYRAILSTLDRLEQFEAQLLSERSLLLVRRFREERDTPEYATCADLYRGTRCQDEWIVLPAQPEGSFLVAPCYPEFQFDLETTSVGKDFYLEELERIPQYLCFSLPYDGLLYKQEAEDSASTQQEGDGR